jgi:ATP-dependent DNA ligase
MSTHEFPVLYGIEKNGKEKVWKAIVTSDKNKAISTITYGQVDGKQQVVTREYTTGKNIGRANETTPYQQAILETERKWKDKKEKEQYQLLETFTMAKDAKDMAKDAKDAKDGKDDPKDDNEEKHPSQDVQMIAPMLAATYSPDKPRKNDITFPCEVQPKLDGLRCVMYMKHGTMVAQSRTGGIFESLSFLLEASRTHFEKYPGLILDGELYTMDIPFETLAGLLKKKKLSDSDKEKLQRHVKYHIYDVVSDQPFHQRNQFILSTEWNPYIEVVPTITVNDWTAGKAQFSQFVEQGFEGLMLRNRNGIYRQGYRSNDLQKYKEFLESEYPIIGFEDGDGRDKGCVIWVCRIPDGKEFRVRPRGTMEQRREWFTNGKQYIGKLLTVIYQELSEQEVPRFPVGKAVRDGY